MKNLFLLILFSFVLFIQCNKENVNPNTELTAFDCIESQDLCDLAKANNQFGFNVLKRLHEAEADKNIFISPTSIATALAMTLNGAEGQTKTDMQQSLQLEGWSLEQINAAYKILIETLPQLDDNVSMQLANSIWYREGFPANKDFLAINEDFYKSEVRDLNFADPTAKDIINNWVADHTNDKIKTIVNNIPSNAVMYLINAIYFKGDWRRPFDPKRTSDRQFFLNNGQTQKVPTMDRGETTLAYFETETFQAVDVPYSDSIFSMTLLLPKEGNNVEQVISTLEATKWEEWTKQIENKDVFFSMPKFKMEYKKELSKVLKDLGMSIAFTGNADFSKIGADNLKIDKVNHKSFIEVNEKGTEAAAVTSVVIIETSAPVIPFMNFNRPFVFLIRENQTNSVLFLGKMMNPKE